MILITYFCIVIFSHTSEAKNFLDVTLNTLPVGLYFSLAWKNLKYWHQGREKHQGRVIKLDVCSELRCVCDVCECKAASQVTELKTHSVSLMWATKIKHQMTDISLLTAKNDADYSETNRLQITNPFHQALLIKRTCWCTELQGTELQRACVRQRGGAIFVRRFRCYTRPCLEPCLRRYKCYWAVCVLKDGAGRALGGCGVQWVVKC